MQLQDGTHANTPGFIRQISSLDVNPDKQGVGLGAEVIVYPSVLPQTESGVNVGAEWESAGGVKRSIGDPDGLTAPKRAPALCKSSRTGSSLSQHLFNETCARKTGPETFERALSITSACYSAVAGR